MSLPVYVTVPLERTRILSSSSLCVPPSPAPSSLLPCLPPRSGWRRSPSAARRRGPRSAGAGCRSRGRPGRSGCRGAPWCAGGIRRCAARCRRRGPPPRCRRPRSRAASAPVAPCWRDLWHRTRRPSRTGPSSSSRSWPWIAAHLGAGLLLEVQEAHHHVGHLHAGVVDVVLHHHVVAAGAQHPHEACRRGRRCAGGRCAPPCWG